MPLYLTYSVEFELPDNTTVREISQLKNTMRLAAYESARSIKEDLSFVDDEIDTRFVATDPKRIS